MGEFRILETKYKHNREPFVTVTQDYVYFSMNAMRAYGFENGMRYYFLIDEYEREVLIKQDTGDRRDISYAMHNNRISNKKMAKVVYELVGGKAKLKSTNEGMAILWVDEA